MADKTILLVEDNADDEELVVRALKKYKVKVNLVVAHDGLEALELLLNHKRPPPALVLLDLKMPRLDGLEVLNRLREDPSGRMVPVVVFTSSSEQEDVVRSYSLGACSYVRKPIPFDEFAEVVRKTAEYWLDVNVTPFPTSRQVSARH